MQADRRRPGAAAKQPPNRIPREKIDSATNTSETIFGDKLISPERTAPRRWRLLMRLGELLIGQGLVSAEDVVEALERQRLQGGRMGNHLVAMGCITVDKLVTALRGLQEVGATLDMCARTFQRWQAMHGPNHPNTHRARYSYARALLASGRGAESLKHAEAALVGCRKTVGEHHAWTDEALQLVADARHAVTANRHERETVPA